MSLNANISENSLVSEQANVVPNKTIASRLREAHGTTGETIAVAIPGAGPVMCVDTVDTEIDGTNYCVLTKTFNEIKQAVDNNIFVIIKHLEDPTIVCIEHIVRIINNPSGDMFIVRTAAASVLGNFLITEYCTDNPNNYPRHNIQKN